MQPILEAVYKIVGTRPNTLDQAKGELIAFLHRNEAKDLIVDDDLQTLMELSSIYAEKEDVVDSKLISFIKRSDPQLAQRVGEVLQPQKYDEHHIVIQELGGSVEKIHPDLHFVIKKDGLGILDAKGVVLYITHIRSIIGIDGEYSFRLTFPRIRLKDELIHLIPESFRVEKVWRFRGTSPCRLEGRYFTLPELLELLMDRKIITYGSYL